MRFFLYFVSMLWLVFGFWLLIVPDFVRRVYMGYFSKTNNVKAWCILPLLAGVLFFLSVNNLKVEAFGYAMSMVATFKGLYLFAIKKNKIKHILDWGLEAPVEFLRIWGVFLIALGLVLFSLIN